MNRDNIRAVADLIEETDRFNMEWYLAADGSTPEHTMAPTVLKNVCGTAGCIAGYVAAWADIEDPWNEIQFTDLVADEFDISFEAARELTLGYCPDLEITCKDAAVAATALRNIADGVIIWETSPDSFGGEYGKWVYA